MKAKENVYYNLRLYTLTSKVRLRGGEGGGGGGGERGLAIICALIFLFRLLVRETISPSSPNGTARFGFAEELSESNMEATGRDSNFLPRDTRVISPKRNVLFKDLYDETVSGGSIILLVIG